MIGRRRGSCLASGKRGGERRGRREGRGGDATKTIISDG